VPYVIVSNATACPSVPPMTNPNQGSTFGIGLNWPNMTYDNIKLSDIQHPAQKVPWADDGYITNPSDNDPDTWLESVNYGWIIYRTPQAQEDYTSSPYRPIARHLKRCSMGFADGHAGAGRVSIMGLQYYPGKTPSGAYAYGDNSGGLDGNGYFDLRWMWTVGSPP
jgi:prepilin-type processing-associated H-X9-DG protein